MAILCHTVNGQDRHGPTRFMLECVAPDPELISILWLEMIIQTNSAKHVAHQELIQMLQCRAMHLRYVPRVAQTHAQYNK